MEEELEQLREELVGARADLERLAERVADREAQALELAGENDALQRQVEAARFDAEQARGQAADLVAGLTGRYRAALLAGAPEVPEALVRGETADAIDESFAAAREAVGRLREQVAAEAARIIPYGAPARGGPDLGGLTAAEKIRAGIEQLADAG